MDETRTSTADGKGTPQTILDEKYRIERVIGEGAFGRVYLATDTRLRRPVAIKELLATRNATDPEVYERYLDRFGREARAGGAITNSHVVTVYELGVDRERNTYLVMEYVDGTNLRDLLAQVGTLPTERAVAIALDIARGLEAVHEMDIAHRDLKPANIMISRRGEAKVGDFGVAQVGSESQRTQTNMGHPGTPMYMSPEQSSGTAYVDGRSDLYSLGLILYEMLVGEAYVRRRVPIRGAKPEIAPALAAVVDRLLQGDPNYRYGSAGEVAADLARLSVAPQAGAGTPFVYAPNPPPPPGSYVPGGGGANAPGYGYGAQGSGGSSLPPVAPGASGYSGTPTGAPGYGSQPPVGYGSPPPASGGGYAPGPPGGYGSPPPYGGQQFGPPPGPGSGPQFYAGAAPQAAPRRRGLSTGAIFGIIGAGVLGLIVLGFALLGASRGGTPTATAIATFSLASLNVTSTSLAATGRAVGTESSGTARALTADLTTTARVTNPTLTAFVRDTNASATAVVRPSGTPRPSPTALMVPTVAVPTIAAPTFSIGGTAASGTPRPTTTRASSTMAASATPRPTMAGGMTVGGMTAGGTGMLYTDPNGRYSFRIPMGFISQDSESASVDAELISPSPLGIIRTISTDSGTPLSLDLAAVAVLTGLKQSNNTFMQTGTTQDVMVNGQPAKRINFTLTDGGVRLQGAMFVLQKGKTTAAVVFFSQPNELDPVIEAGKSVLDSFTFL